MEKKLRCPSLDFSSHGKFITAALEQEYNNNIRNLERFCTYINKVIAATQSHQDPLASKIWSTISQFYQTITNLKDSEEALPFLEWVSDELRISPGSASPDLYSLLCDIRLWTLLGQHIHEKGIRSKIKTEDDVFNAIQLTRKMAKQDSKSFCYEGKKFTTPAYLASILGGEAGSSLLEEKKALPFVAPIPSRLPSKSRLIKLIRTQK